MKRRRIISFWVALMLLLAIFPTSALASGQDEQTPLWIDRIVGLEDPQCQERVFYQWLHDEAELAFAGEPSLLANPFLPVDYESPSIDEHEEVTKTHIVQSDDNGIYILRYVFSYSGSAEGNYDKQALSSLIEEEVQQNRAEIAAAYDAFLLDHPKVFWMARFNMQILTGAQAIKVDDELINTAPNTSQFTDPEFTYQIYLNLVVHQTISQSVSQDIDKNYYSASVNQENDIVTVSLNNVIPYADAARQNQIDYQLSYDIDSLQVQIASRKIVNGLITEKVTGSNGKESTRIVALGDNISDLSAEIDLSKNEDGTMIMTIEGRNTADPQEEAEVFTYETQAVEGVESNLLYGRDTLTGVICTVDTANGKIYLLDTDFLTFTTVTLNGNGANTVEMVKIYSEYRSLDYMDGGHYTDEMLRRQEVYIDQILEAYTGTGTADQLYYVHDYLINNNSYNTYVKLAGTARKYCSSDAWAAYPALEGNAGTQSVCCSGYSKAFKVLCDAMGIPCVLEEGKAKADPVTEGGDHMWNRVKLNNQWYYLDITADDSLLDPMGVLEKVPYLEDLTSAMAVDLELANIEGYAEFNQAIGGGERDRYFLLSPDTVPMYADYAGGELGMRIACLYQEWFKVVDENGNEVGCRYENCPCRTISPVRDSEVLQYRQWGFNEATEDFIGKRNEYTVSYFNKDNSLHSRQKVGYESTPVAPTDMPNGALTNYTTSFVGWRPLNVSKDGIASSYIAVYDATHSSQTSPISLKYPTLSFEDMIVMNVYYAVSDMTDICEMGLITYDHEVQQWNMLNAEQVISGYAYHETNDLYRVSTNGIAPQNLGETIWFAVYAKLTDGSYTYSRLVSYSPKAYAYSLLSNGADIMKPLVVSMLNYGAAAQAYFGSQDAPINAGLTQEQQQLVAPYSASMMEAVTAVESSKIGVEGDCVQGGFSQQYRTVTFGETFSLNFKFVPENTPNKSIRFLYWTQDTYEQSDKLIPANASGSIKMYNNGFGVYTGKVDGIAVKELDDTVYAAAFYTSGGTQYWSGILSYSVGAYCNALVSNNSAMSDLAASTVVYSYYAKQVFGA